jgi:hypothetical protein
MAGRASTPILPSVHGADGSVCHLLRSQLPNYDDITVAISSNGHWWDSFWMKAHTISQVPNSTPVDSLLAFAAQAYTSHDPAQLATLAVAYVRCLNQSHRLLATVDGLVMSDLRLASTIAGLDCLVLLGKTYTDIGQPRREWMMWRKGLAITQMMVRGDLQDIRRAQLTRPPIQNFHRLDLNIPGTRQRIWWAIYHGDRFTSLLLELPHGFNDAHLEQSLARADGRDSNSWLATFIHDCATMAGEVIDSSMTSFAKSMLLDEKMDGIYHSAPVSWWHASLEDDQLRSRMQLQQLVERLLIHIFFFHIRMYIHLPLLKSTSGQRPDQHFATAVSKQACGEAARQILSRYLLLRTHVDGHSLFDCKTTDFVAFTAAVVIIITKGASQHSSVHTENDELGLVWEVHRLFQAAGEKDPECKLTAQCRIALSVLLGHIEDGTDGNQDITIPYFGKVLRRRTDHASRTIEDTEGGGLIAGNVSAPEISAHIFADSPSSSWLDGFNIDFTELQLPSIGDENTIGTGGTDGMNASSPSWFDVASLDIDQDWSLFDM